MRNYSPLDELRQKYALDAKSAKDDMERYKQDVLKKMQEELERKKAEQKRKEEERKTRMSTRVKYVITLQFVCAFMCVYLSKCLHVYVSSS